MVLPTALARHVPCAAAGSPEMGVVKPKNQLPFDPKVVGTYSCHGVEPGLRQGETSAKINQDRGVVSWPFNYSWDQARSGDCEALKLRRAARATTPPRAATCRAHVIRRTPATSGSRHDSVDGRRSSVALTGTAAQATASRSSA